MQGYRTTDGQTKRHPLVLLIIDSCILAVVVIGSFIAWDRYSVWYEDTVPVAPIPENTRLLWRRPELKKNEYPYYSSIARYWYYARYSTTTPYEDVKKFYKDKYDASPFGDFWVDILPPATMVVSEDNRYHRIEREKDDPPNETIILAEVSKTPSDESLFIMLWLCSIPAMFLMGLCVIVYRQIVRIKARKLPAPIENNGKS